MDHLLHARIDADKNLILYRIRRQPGFSNSAITEDLIVTLTPADQQSIDQDLHVAHYGSPVWPATSAAPAPAPQHADADPATAGGLATHAPTHTDIS